MLTVKGREGKKDLLKLRMITTIVIMTANIY